MATLRNAEIRGASYDLPTPVAGSVWQRTENGRAP
jgi:hypothetical protein